MGTVIKRDGKRQAFSPAKVRKSIESAGKDANLSKSKIQELVKEVANSVIALYSKKRVKAVQLRKSILRRLNRRAKSVSAAWRRFERNKK